MTHPSGEGSLVLFRLLNIKTTGFYLWLDTLAGLVDRCVCFDVVAFLAFCGAGR